MKTIINFLSSRINLTILQCVCYFVIGWIMGEYLNWIQFGIVFVVLFLIQFITRTKAVADGMMYRQLMVENEWEVNEVIQKIKDEADKARKDNNLN